MFDVLLSAGRPLSAEEICQAIRASLDGTERLLAACSGLQLLNTHQEDGQGQSTHAQIQVATMYELKVAALILMMTILFCELNS